MVHPVPGEDGKKNTLVNAILYHCKNDLPTINWVERPGIVHRLDKDTSGAIMIAKNDKMMKELSSLIKLKKSREVLFSSCKWISKRKGITIGVI